MPKFLVRHKDAIYKALVQHWCASAQEKMDAVDSEISRLIYNEFVKPYVRRMANFPVGFFETKSRLKVRVDSNFLFHVTFDKPTLLPCALELHSKSSEGKFMLKLDKRRDAAAEKFVQTRNEARAAARAVYSAKTVAQLKEIIPNIEQLVPLAELLGGSAGGVGIPVKTAEALAKLNGKPS